MSTDLTGYKTREGCLDAQPKGKNCYIFGSGNEERRWFNEVGGEQYEALMDSRKATAEGKGGRRRRRRRRKSRKSRKKRRKSRKSKKTKRRRRRRRRK